METVLGVLPKLNKWKLNINLVVKNCYLKSSPEQQSIISKKKTLIKKVFICSKVNNGEKKYFILMEDGFT